MMSLSFLSLKSDVCWISYYRWKFHDAVYELFCKIVNFNDLGPPESMREHVVAASKEMGKGNWRECAEYILAVKVDLWLKHFETILF